MKLISLNIWGGHIQEPLLEFIATHRDVDILCFQEVYHDAKERISTEERLYCLTIFSEIQKRLPEHVGLFRPVVNGVYGIAMFVKKSIDILNEGEVIIHDNPPYSGRVPTHSRNLQWVECLANDRTYTIINIHGLWNGQGKSDSPERIAQSQIIKRFCDSVTTPKILCGDFNLRPETESIKILEEGMTNLVKDYNIQSTRTSLYPRIQQESFADYILTSADITVHHFEVMKHEVSDHAPLLLEFS